MIATLRGRLRDEAGFSLVELLTVIILLMVTSGIAYSGIAMLFRQTVHAEERISAVTTMQTVAANITRDIRAADSSSGPIIRHAAPARIEFDVFRDLGIATDPLAFGISRMRFTYRMQGTTLTEDRRVWANRTADPATVASTSSMSRPVMFAVAVSDGVFRFWNQDGACVTGCAGITTTYSGTAAQLAGITDVGLYLSRSPGSGRAVIDVEAKVRLRNAP